MPILVFLGLSVLELGPMYATDRQTSDAHHRLMPPRRGHNNVLRDECCYRSTKTSPRPGWPACVACISSAALHVSPPTHHDVTSRSYHCHWRHTPLDDVLVCIEQRPDCSVHQSRSSAVSISCNSRLNALR